MEVCGNIEKRLSALEAQVRKLVGPKAAADSGLVRFGDLELNDWFEYGNKFYIKSSVHYAREGGKIGDWRIFSSDDIVRPIEAEIRKRLPGEMSMGIDADTACDALGCNCADCRIGNSHMDCKRFNYTWTLTATPKLTKITEEAN